MRSEIKAGTPLGQAAKSRIDAGKLVPDETVIGMIRNKIEANKDARGFIFDGFPRTKEQAKALDELLEEENSSVSMMLALTVPREELIHRLVERGKESNRSDDKEEVIKDRLDVYHEETAPLKEYYQSQNKLREIDGLGDIDEINARLCKAIDAVS